MNRKKMKLLFVLALAVAMLGCGAEEKETEISTVKVDEVHTEMTKEENDAYNKAVVEKEFADDVFVVKKPVIVETVENESNEDESKETYVVVLDEENVEVEIGAVELTEEEIKKIEEEANDKSTNGDSQVSTSKTGYCCAFSKYRDMTGTEQKTFAEKFSDMDAFFDWYDQAEIEHEKHDTAIEIGNGPIDMEKILEGNSQSE